MKPLLLLLALFACAPLNVAAATWVEVAGNDDVAVFVDIESIRKNGNRVKVWLKWQWAKPTEVPNSYPVKTYQSEKQLQISDCANRTLAIAQGIRYAKADGGEVVDTYTVPERNWFFSEAAPETIGEKLIKVSCKGIGGKKN